MLLCQKATFIVTENTFKKVFETLVADNPMMGY